MEQFRVGFSKDVGLRQNCTQLIECVFLTKTRVFENNRLTGNETRLVFDQQSEPTDKNRVVRFCEPEPPPADLSLSGTSFSVVDLRKTYSSAQTVKEKLRSMRQCNRTQKAFVV